MSNIEAKYLLQVSVDVKEKRLAIAVNPEHVQRVAFELFKLALLDLSKDLDSCPLIRVELWVIHDV